MRILYFILYFTLKYAIRIFYPRQTNINSPKQYFGSTIYVSNHAASFMDPLVVASNGRPIVFFMTRSDIFTPLLKPILWASHMLPIYRQLDGDDTKGKNEAIFNKCARILSFGRNLLIFGEGFTDDTFIRRLKPVKKGAVRIGFLTLEKLNWKKKIYIAAVGCNYSNPNEIGSDILISTSDKICLNDFRDAYAENPNKVINELTKRIEQLMREQITHIEEKEFANFHEDVMKLTRKGMNSKCFDRKISLKKRWEYSRKLAHWFNENVTADNEALMSLKNDLESYFKLQQKLKIEEKYLYAVSTNTNAPWKNLVFLILSFPLMLLGVLHCAIPYFLIKRLVEKSFKRKVFWGSVKLLLGTIIIGLVNIPFIFVFYHVIYESYWLGFVYYALIGVFGTIAYKWFENYTFYKVKTKMKQLDHSKMWSKRTELVERINALIPVA